MKDGTLIKLKKFELQLNESKRTKIDHKAKWRTNLPNEAGVYIVREKSKIIYVGETGNIEKRMSDLSRTLNHNFRRTIGEKLFSGRKDYVKATSRLKYNSNQEEELNQWIGENCTVSFIVLDFG